jgi:hypothetical protein
MVKKCLSAIQQISKFIHSADNEVRPTDCEDRLYKVRSVLTSLVSTFQQVYVPEKQISIDEGMIAWKGCLIVNVYMPNKPGRCGIKACLVSEYGSGYIHTTQVYN